MRPVHLSLFSRKSTQAKKRFPGSRTDPGNKPSQLHDAAIEAPVSDHLIDSCCPQVWIFCQYLPNEVGIRVGCVTRRLGSIEPIGFHGRADGLRVKAKFTGNGSNFPMFCIKQVANV